MIRISLEGLDPKPSAIYLGNNRSYYGTGLGFAGHTQVMNLLDRENAPYFKHCLPCQFNKIYQKTGDTKVGCPGGIRYLTGRYEESYTRIANTRYRVPTFSKSCRRQLAEEFVFNTSVEVPFSVKIPDYILVNTRGYNLGSSYKLRAYLAKPEANSLEDLWLGIPFVFGNTHIAGNVCLGSSSDGVSWSDWSTIQHAYLNFSRNNDWTEYWKSRERPELATLVDYATRLNAEGAKFVNQFAYSDFKDWRTHIFSDTDFPESSRKILEYKPEYKTILFDKNNTNLFYIELFDGTTIDTNLDPVQLEGSSHEW